MDGDGDLDVYSQMVVFENQGLDTQNLKITPDQQMISSAFQLYQNFPNPFNPTTTIEFSIPQSGMVTMTIYDVLGREVETILNEYRNTGYHNLRWNATNISSGIYFVRMQSGGFSQVRKLMVVR